MRKKGCLLRDLVRVRDRDVFTSVSRALLGEPGHTYRYLDTRLFAIPWHTEDTEAKGPRCCDLDLSTACKALSELNAFFCTDVSHLKEGDRLCAKGDAEPKQAEEGDTESKHSEESKNSEGGESESRQSEEGDTESKHSEEWDVESKHSDEGCSGSKPEAEWETESRHSSEEEESTSQTKVAGEKASEPEQVEGKLPSCESRSISGSFGTRTVGSQEKPVTQLKHSLSDYHIGDKEDATSRGQSCSQPSPPQKYTGPAKFNVTLINYMDPAAMSQLKEEPYYGMGKMAVGWHHDENLLTHSPVAVYSYSCQSDKGETFHRYGCCFYHWFKGSHCNIKVPMIVTLGLSVSAEVKKPLGDLTPQVQP